VVAVAEKSGDVAVVTCVVAVRSRNLAVQIGDVTFESRFVTARL
jgi:hypothetical protein